MSDQEESTEGIVLRSQDYKERDRIMTLFTPQGVVGCIVRNISRKNSRLLGLTTPFCHAQYHYKRTKSELVTFVDGTVVNAHLDLRGSYSFLQTAGLLANMILLSQMPGKAAPLLFALYKAYHSRVVGFLQPRSLLASFYLKLLKHEGLLSLSSSCSSCKEKAQRIDEGASFCCHHSPNGIPFSPTEWELLLQLDNASSFSALQELMLPPNFYEKIQILFAKGLE